MAKATSTTLENLKALLADFPMDRRQRDSVLENAADMPEEKILAMTRRMRATVDALEAKVRELNGLMRSGEVRVVRESAAATAYQVAVPA
jgi:hypothetical protein